MSGIGYLTIHHTNSFLSDGYRLKGYSWLENRVQMFYYRISCIFLPWCKKRGIGPFSFVSRLKITFLLTPKKLIRVQGTLVIETEYFGVFSGLLILDHRLTSTFKNSPISITGFTGFCLLPGYSWSLNISPLFGLHIRRENSYVQKLDESLWFFRWRKGY